MDSENDENKLGGDSSEEEVTEVMESADLDSGDPEEEGRRGFLQAVSALVIGAFISLVPAGVGLSVLTDPLRRKKGDGGFVKVTNLDALPSDGIPRQFRILADRQDAWNRFPNVPVGAIYLRRTEEDGVQAFNVICPHLGCAVDYRDDLGSYHCPCHDSTFAKDGSINDPKSPSPRGLDVLEIEIRNNNEVWVKFQNFQTGIPEKVAIV